MVEGLPVVGVQAPAVVGFLQKEVDLGYFLWSHLNGKSPLYFSQKAHEVRGGLCWRQLSQKFSPFHLPIFKEGGDGEKGKSLVLDGKVVEGAN